MDESEAILIDENGVPETPRQRQVRIAMETRRRQVRTHLAAEEVRAGALAKGQHFHEIVEELGRLPKKDYWTEFEKLSKQGIESFGDAVRDAGVSAEAMNKQLEALARGPRSPIQAGPGRVFVNGQEIGKVSGMHVTRVDHDEFHGIPVHVDEAIPDGEMYVFGEKSVGKSHHAEDLFHFAKHRDGDHDAPRFFFDFDEMRVTDIDGID